MTRDSDDHHIESNNDCCCNSGISNDGDNNSCSISVKEPRSCSMEFSMVTTILVL